ncbi:GNAT family N-acetyltransferase [Streptomyces sp. ZYX-F-203]
MERDNAVPLVAARRVRRRTARDVEGCAGVLAEVHRADGYPMDWPEDPRSWLTPCSSLASWVAEADGCPVGHVGLARSGPGDAAPAAWSDRTGRRVEKAAVVNRLFVAPSARGHGLGGLLLSRAVRHADGLGLRAVLDVAAHDTAARALYESLGWEFLGSVDQWWGPGRRVTVCCYGSVPGARFSASVARRTGSDPVRPRSRAESAPFTSTPGGTPGAAARSAPQSAAPRAWGG